jgi:hypothetical protein
MMRAVVSMESCEIDLWKGARKPVVAVSLPSPGHAGPKPPAVVPSERFGAGGVHAEL